MIDAVLAQEESILLRNFGPAIIQAAFGDQFSQAR
jgi:hypothetical protein